MWHQVMHGADWDIPWLQRDFGLYIVNLFDTGQASRVLKLPKYSLAFLLQYCCDVVADKQYQLADWRIRYIPPPISTTILCFNPISASLYYPPPSPDHSHLRWSDMHVKIHIIYYISMIEWRMNSFVEWQEGKIYYRWPLTSAEIFVWEFTRKKYLKKMLILNYITSTNGISAPSRYIVIVMWLSCDSLFLFSATVFAVVVWVERLCGQRWRWESGVRESHSLLTHCLSHSLSLSPRYVLPNHMLFQISEQLPREAQGVLACCTPIPTLVRQQLQEVFMLVQEAKQTQITKQVYTIHSHVYLSLYISPISQWLYFL